MNKIAILSSLLESTGNLSTAQRLANIIGLNKTVLLDIKKFNSSYELNVYLNKNPSINLVYGIHAYKAGKLLMDCKVPYVLIFGGTDININSCYASDMIIMTKAVKKSKGLVSLSHEMTRKINQLWINQSVDVIRPSIPKCNYSDKPHTTPYKNIILCAGIRPVKNIAMAIEFIRDCPDYHLSIYGPILDKDYYQQCIENINTSSNISYNKVVNHDILMRTIGNMDILINTSDSEGVCTSILEAMSLGTIVLVRNISSNADIIINGINGFLFDNKQDFIDKLEYINSMSIMRKRRLCETAQTYVNVFHKEEAEKRGYRELQARIM